MGFCAPEVDYLCKGGFGESASRTMDVINSGTSNRETARSRQTAIDHALTQELRYPGEIKSGNTAVGNLQRRFHRQRQRRLLQKAQPAHLLHSFPDRLFR